MKIDVVGGSGFIGTRLCQRFVRSGKAFQILDKAPSLAFPDQAVLADVRPLSLYDEVNVGVAMKSIHCQHLIRL